MATLHNGREDASTFDVIFLVPPAQEFFNLMVKTATDFRSEQLIWAYQFRVDLAAAELKVNEWTVHAEELTRLQAKETQRVTIRGFQNKAMASLKAKLAEAETEEEIEELSRAAEAVYRLSDDSSNATIEQLSRILGADHAPGAIDSVPARTIQLAPSSQASSSLALVPVSLQRGSSSHSVIRTIQVASQAQADSLMDFVQIAMQEARESVDPVPVQIVNEIKLPEIKLPDRITTSTVNRNAKGDIVKVIQRETDAPDAAAA